MTIENSLYPLLDTIDSPADLRCLPLAELPQLCAELRGFLLETVAQTGGHLGAGLGVVELTVAIHYVFDTPDDSLVWDVGHQAYPHKILSQRRKQMHTLRQFNGLSGFPKRDESVYDAFGVGHASTAVSAVLGMAIADQVAGLAHSHIAVIGDSAMTAGMVYEALQHSVETTADIWVILNDNNMSISETSATRTQTTTNMARWFGDFGFDYTGVTDGHDVLGLVETLTALKQQQGSKLLHVKTVKGKGYANAEADPVAYHGVPPFNLSRGLKNDLVSQGSNALTFTRVFSDWLVDTATHDEKLLAITPAMCEGSGLVAFSEQFPQRYFDVDIAEQHAVTLAAGMACRGAKPVVAIYSTFLQRAYDQLVHDVALQNLDVLFAVDRAGVVGEDGATHAGIFDLAYSRALPNMVVMTPSDEAEMYLLLNTGYHYKGPALVRYPKGHGNLGSLGNLDRLKASDNVLNTLKTTTLPIGKAHVVQRGETLAILVFGTLLSRLEDYAQANNATLVDMRFVKPLDAVLLAELAETHRYVVTVEEGSLQGGIGEHVAQFFNEQHHSIRTLALGIADGIVPHGKRDEVLTQYRLDKNSLQADIDAFWRDTEQRGYLNEQL